MQKEKNRSPEKQNKTWKNQHHDWQEITWTC